MPIKIPALVSNHFILTTLIFIRNLTYVRTTDSTCNINDYTFYVSIVSQKSNRIICGGTLLGPLWVLTAGRCCKSDPVPDWYMVYGGEKNQTYMLGMQRSHVASCYIHPKYHSESHYNDVCLVKIKTPFIQDSHTSYVRFKLRGDDSGEMCKNGMTISTSGSIKSYSYKCDFLPILNKTVCKNLASYNRKSFCTKPPNNEKANCYSDAGGPYLCGKIQYGIVTGSVAGCGSNHPTICTDVQKFAGFIWKILQSKAKSLHNRKCVLNFAFILFVVTFFQI